MDDNLPSARQEGVNYKMSPTNRLIIGISGSSAPQLALTMLRTLKEVESIEVHLVGSKGAEKSIEYEIGMTRKDVEALGDIVYDPEDLGAAISSGSFKTMGMIVIPCSMRTLAAIASGYTPDLLTRTADVCLKERRKLVMVTRETPLSLIHLRNMESATLAGATILPPVPAFYHHPQTIDDLLKQTVGKVLDQFEIDHQLFKRWEGTGTKN